MAKPHRTSSFRSVLAGGRRLSLVLAGTALGGWLGQSALAGLFPAGMTVCFWGCLLAAVWPALAPAWKRPAISDNRFWEGTLLLCSLCCGSALSGAALQPDHVDYLRYFRLAGFLPFLDAYGLYGAAVDWPADSFSIQSSHRPLGTVLDILAFHAGGRTLLGSYFLKACLAAAAVAAFIRALSLHAGRAAAWTAGSVLLYWVWPFLPMQMSETNGFILSVFGLSLLLSAPVMRRPALAFWGMAGMALAEMVRSANPLLVLALAFGTAFRFPFFRNRLATGLLLSGFALVLQLALPALLLRWYGHPDASANSNSGAILLGLARGTGWLEAETHVLRQHPEWVRPDSVARPYELFSFDEKQVNREQLSQLLPTVRAQPQVLVSSLKRGFELAFHQFFQKVTEALGLHRYSQSWGRPLFWLPFYGGLVFLCWLLVRTHRTLVLLSALSLASFFAFAPVVYKDTGWRIACTQMGGLAMAVSLIPLGIRHLLCRATGTAQAESRPPAASADSPAVRMAVAWLAFAVLSTPYPALYRMLAGTASPEGNPSVLTVSVSADQQPGWTGLNSASVTPDMLVSWVAWLRESQSDAGHWVALERFLLENADQIREIRLAGVLPVLVVSDGKVCEACHEMDRPFPGFRALRCQVAAGRE
jgi:hypothetical protein